MKTAFQSVICSVVLMCLLSCAKPPRNTQNAEVAETCVDPRPQICTMDYTPVCGLRGEDWSTYSNACSACSDAEVSGYRAGECRKE